MIISIAAKKFLCNVILTDPDEIMKMKLVKKVTANDGFVLVKSMPRFGGH